MKSNIVLAAMFLCGAALLLAGARPDVEADALSPQPAQYSVICEKFGPNDLGSCGNNLCGMANYTYNPGFSSGPGTQTLDPRTISCPDGNPDDPNNPCRNTLQDIYVAVDNAYCCGTDSDNDGYYTGCNPRDCVDNNPNINPGMPEVCGDGIDNDCSGGDLACPTPTPTPDPDFNPCWDPYMMEECESRGGIWKGCRGCFSPIVMDTRGDGFNLTSAAAGVSFDIDGDGAAENLSWTAARSDDSWLFLDRNGNGVVDSGLELFGNYSPQPPSNSRNGFLALAEYDKPDNGGNGDGLIDAKDTVYPSLRLWRDENHNGASEPHELHALPAFDVAALELDYRESRRTDRHGNMFLYRAKVRDGGGVKVGRWAWDVFLRKAP